MHDIASVTRGRTSGRPTLSVQVRTARRSAAPRAGEMYVLVQTSGAAQRSRLATRPDSKEDAKATSHWCS